MSAYESAEKSGQSAIWQHHDVHDARGILRHLIIDVPGQAVNTLGSAAMNELEAAIDQVSKTSRYPHLNHPQR